MVGERERKGHINGMCKDPEYEPSKSMETKSKSWVAGGQEGAGVTAPWEMGSPFGVIQMFWNQTVGMAARHCKRTKCHCIAHLKTI